MRSMLLALALAFLVVGVASAQCGPCGDYCPAFSQGYAPAYVRGYGPSYGGSSYRHRARYARGHGFRRGYSRPVYRSTPRFGGRGRGIYRGR